MVIWLWLLAFQEECFTKIEELKAEVRDVKDLLRRVLDGFQSREIGITTQHTYPTLPLRSKEELMKTEEILEDKNQYNLMVSPGRS